MKMLWIETCDDCRWCESVGLTRRCAHPGFKGKGKSRELRQVFSNTAVALIIPISVNLCPLPDAIPPADKLTPKEQLEEIIMDIRTRQSETTPCRLCGAYRIEEPRP